MKKTVVIVAGGRGERMHSDIPKQFIPLLGKPVLMHTIKAFHRYDPSISIIVVLPASQINFWEELCIKYNFSISCRIVEGGATRFHSVKNGLNAADPGSFIAVHDGVRPLVSSSTIARCFESAAQYKAVVPVIDSADSIRCVEAGGSRALDRTKIKLVQTPQVFEGGLLIQSYRQDFSPAFTDDASVVEASGGKIHLVEGCRENIKITNAFDLKLAACLLDNLS